MSGSTMVSADSQMGSDEPKSRLWPCSKAHAKGCMFKGTGSQRVESLVRQKGQERGVQNRLPKGVDTGTALTNEYEVDRKTKSVAESPKMWRQRARWVWGATSNPV